MNKQHTPLPVGDERFRIVRKIEAQQKIQQTNPPTSAAWQAASVKIHRLAEQLTGKKPQDARG